MFTGFPLPSLTNPGELAFNFVILYDLEQLVQHPTLILDRLGDTPNILDLFFTSSPSAYDVTLSSQLGSSDHNLICILSYFSNPSSAFTKARGASGVLPLPVGGPEEVLC
ncbi:hypothetical protein E2C01_035918 [Portunus trituberculatus]|uniref:Endonuclease/exonuclease/phosphatase domain-containing protein n=1 Tax=Portunus trituberculatus TaxID=210409 RepID=A0A5B7FAL1_PORTR|nr:hypothetical protein [Portunus trituberculatus]